MSTFLCKNGVRKEYFLTPTFIIEPKKPWATFPLSSINKNQLPCLTLSVETGELFIFLPSKMKYDANHGSCSKPDHRVDLFELRRKDEQYSCQ